MKKQQASPEMQKFFQKLLETKKCIWDHLEKDPDNEVLQEIFFKINGVIKDGDKPNA